MAAGDGSRQAAVLPAHARAAALTHVPERPVMVVGLAADESAAFIIAVKDPVWISGGRFHARAVGGIRRIPETLGMDGLITVTL